MDRLTSMAVFVKAVDLGSFAAAAAALDLSGPMVGKHVRFLEERIGVRLINRTTRRQSLTDFGRAYYERCRVVLAEAEAADGLAADQLSEPRGKLRVTMPVLFGRRCVAPILLALAQNIPGLSLPCRSATTSPISRRTATTSPSAPVRRRTGPGSSSAASPASRWWSAPSPSYLEAHGRPEQSKISAGIKPSSTTDPARCGPGCFRATAGRRRSSCPSADCGSMTSTR